MLTDPSFENLREEIRTAPRSASALERRITWVGTSRRLGFARDHEGLLEVFLVGESYAAREKTVGEHLVHDVWRTTAGASLAANRLRLPPDDHFNAMSAAILLELLDKGYERQPHEALRRTEPLIALALESSHLENPLLTGLAGELLTLATMIRIGRSPAASCLDSWQGWDRSSRDFQLGPIGVEVKTTTTSASRHHIQGWYQVECGVAADGVPETHLYLLSIGIRWLAEGSPGITLEGLVKEIVQALPGAGRSAFVDGVRRYGGADLAVEDDGTAGQSSLRQPFMATFERLYDLRDDRIRLPRSDDFSSLVHVVSDSVRFEIELPPRILGDRNPVVGLAKAVQSLPAAAFSS